MEENLESIEGYVDHIIYRNADNGYTVLVLVCKEEEETCVGVFSDIAEGENIKAKGSYTEHPTYGRQFQVKSFEEKAPQDEVAIERYLGSGAIKGVGASLAGRIVKKFREDTFRIIEEEPERLAEVRGREKRYAEGNDLSSEIWDFDDTCSKDLSVLRSEDLSGTGRKSIPACRSDSGDRI